VFTASLYSGLQGVAFPAGAMVRWFVLATDSKGRWQRAPANHTPDAPHYHGTGIVDPFAEHTGPNPNPNPASPTRNCPRAL
jgi:hypothetical protein